MQSGYADENRKHYTNLYSADYFSAAERYGHFLRGFKPDTVRVLDVGCNRGSGGEF